MSQVARGQARDEAPPSEQTSEGGEFHSNGTLTILLIYLVLIVVLWGSMFLIMLERS